MSAAMTYLPPEQGFLGLSADEAGDPARAGAVIIPFGFEGTVSYEGGTANGPEAIIAASPQLEFFDDELWREPFRDYRIATLAPFPIKDGAAAALSQLDKVVGQVLDGGAFPMVLGGEHSLTAGAIRPHLRRHEEMAILHFDAHADLRDGYEGEHYSHAAALRRCLDHERVVKLVSVGIRNISAGEIPYLESQGDRITIHWGRDRKAYDPAAIVAPLAGLPTYVTFDLDGFDSSLMPATGTPEPGGLFWDDALPILRAAARITTIVGADVVELAPRPGLHACDFVAAKLVYKILNYALSGPEIR